MQTPADAWHARSAEHVFKALHSSSQGLDSPQAQARLRDSGENRIDREPGQAWLRVLLRQLAEPMVYVLLVATVLAAAMGRGADALVILAVVVLNTTIGFVQELRAGRAIASLGRLVPRLATVLRDGVPVELPATQVVPGDVLLLQPGDQVAADLRLFDVNGLSIEESMLTGESLPSTKHTAPVHPGAELGDRRPMAYGGTLVTAGTGRGIVVATGMRSEFGRIAHLLHSTAALQTPLTRRLARLARTLTLAILAVAGLILLLGLWRGHPLLDSALAALTLAVASIPEGLPAVITIASAIGVQRMARHRAIIRHLSAVETLGSTTVICTDKTGTLTRNEMTVAALWTPAGPVEVGGAGYEPRGVLQRDGRPLASLPADLQPLLLAALLCNDARLDNSDGHWQVVGDPTEGALLVAARKGGLDEAALNALHPRLDEIPFSPERKFMATLHARADGTRQVWLKGAPEVVTQLCPHMADGSPTASKLIHEAAHALARRGMRVLAMAGASVAADADLQSDGWRDGLRFIGLVGMTDPPRPEAIDAIRDCHRAGITVKMVTGDHPLTAHAIGQQIGLLAAGDGAAQVVTGRQIEAASGAALAALARSAQVFARVAPEHKLRLVEALQAEGEVVAMTGDGVNDAPALKRADIGIAMGIKGTAVAREAADMVLTDDNFAAISAAVREGRRVYDNLVKTLAFVLPTSLGQSLIILVAVLFFPLTDGHLLMPVEPVQILWVNLVVAITLALPLAFEAREPGLMERPPRPPGEALLSPFLVVRTLLVGVLMTVAIAGLFLHAYQADVVAGVAPDLARAQAQTLAVTAIMLFQSLYLLHCRSLSQGLRHIGLLSNRWVPVGILACLALQLAFVYLAPFNELFHTHPLDAHDWLLAAAIAVLGNAVISLEKRLWRGRGGSPR